MDKNTRKNLRRDRIRRRIRSTIRGTETRPRLCVFKSNKHIYAQLVDDLEARTLVASSSESESLREDLEDKTRTERAEIVGADIAKLAEDKGITKAVFDRSGYKYHGVIKALANSAREAGLDF